MSWGAGRGGVRKQGIWSKSSRISLKGVSVPPLKFKPGYPHSLDYLLHTYFPLFRQTTLFLLLTEGALYWGRGDNYIFVFREKINYLHCTIHLNFIKIYCALNRINLFLFVKINIPTRFYLSRFRGFLFLSIT